MSDKLLIYILAPILTALLSWIGLLIKRELETRDTRNKQQDDILAAIGNISLVMNTVVDSIIILSASVKVLSKCNEVELQSLHNSGVMNGQTEQQLNLIADEVRNLDELISRLQSIEKIPQVATAK
jgi:hypothetical protein